jgi:hypothetical protein
MYNSQYVSWLGGGKLLDISQYFSTVDDAGAYDVASVGDLQNMLGFSEQSGLHFKLMSDVDLAGSPGFFIPYFSGTFDGAGHTIQNLNILEQNNDLGLFGILQGASVSNVSLNSATVSGWQVVGGLVGYANQSSINNSSSQGTISGVDWVGGLGGLIVNGTIASSFSISSVSGSYFGVGGLVGETANANISLSYSQGTVQGSNSVGGLIGYDQGDTIDKTFSSSVVTGRIYAGGLIGNIYNVTLSNSYAEGPVSGGTDVGGLIGYVQQGSVANAYAAGGVTGTTQSGGLIGDGVNITIASSYWDTQATGQATSVGGVGLTTAQMQDATNYSTVYAGWDFSNTWSPPSTGFYPQLYAVSHVLRVTPEDASSVYGTNPLLTANYYGLQDGDTASVVDGLILAPSNPSFSGTSGFMNVGSYATSGSGASASGASGAYRIIYGVGNLSVTPATLTLTAGSASKTYDGTVSAPNAPLTVTGLVAGDSLTASVSFASANAGPESLEVNLISLDDGNADQLGANYNTVSQSATGSILPATLTAALIGSVTKTYDGSLVATLAPTNYALSGVVGGDTVGLNDPTSGTYASKDAGTGIAVSVTGLALTNNAAGDYVLASTNASAPIGLIDPATLTASLVGTVEKTYDGTTAATLTSANYQLSGIVTGDNVALNAPTSGAYATQNAGTGIAVSVSGLSLSNNAAGDYVLAATNASAPIGIIDPKLLTISLIGSVSKVYDGATSIGLSPSNYTLPSGVLPGDHVSFSDPSTGVLATKNVGSGLLVTVSNGALSGPQAGDYTVGPVAGNIGAVTPAPLTLAAQSATKTYDGTTTSAVAPLVSGLAAGDSVANLTQSYAAANAGAEMLSVNAGYVVNDGDSGQDYSVTLLSAMGRINPKALTATLVGVVDKTYDGTTAATLSSSEYSLSGLVSGDSVGLAAGSGAYANKNVGTGINVTFTGLSLTGSSASNYTLSSSGVSGAFGEIDPKQLTISLVGVVDKTYNGTTVATLTGTNYSALGGVIAGDSVTVSHPSSGTYATQNVGTGILVTANGVALSGAQAADYKLGSVTGLVGEIDPKALTASLVGSVSRVYDGQTDATLTASNYHLTGVVSGDTVGLNDPTVGIFDTKDVGTGKTISVTGLALINNPYGDYSLATSTLSGTIGKITPLALTASLSGIVEKTYDGTTTATLTSGDYTLHGVLAGDSVTLNDPLSGVYNNANAGANKTVTVTGLALLNNAAGDYSLSAASVSAAIGLIDPMLLTASLTGTVEKTYNGNATATLTAANYSLTGGVISGDTVSLNDPTAGAYASANAGSGIEVIVNGVRLTGASAGNYTIGAATLMAPIGVIDPKTLTATLIGSVVKTYDGTTTATLTPANYSLPGVVSGDTVALNDPTTGTYGTQNAGSGIAVTAQGLALSGSSAANYQLASTSIVGNIGKINPKALTATLVGTVTKVYDATTTAYLSSSNYLLAGIVAGDTITLDDPTTGTYNSATVGTGKTVKVTGLSISGSDPSNYTVNTTASAAIGTITAH